MQQVGLTVSFNAFLISCRVISDFEGLAPARYLRHGAQPEEFPEIHGLPQLEPYWAAGFSFSRGHFKLRVPYDAYQPMVFQVSTKPYTLPYPC